MYLAIIAQGGATGGGGGFLGFLPFILIMVIVYLMMIRPQMKKQKAHGSMLASLRKNDEVVTAGGLHGRIVQISEKSTSVQVQIAKGIIVTVDRGSISRKKETGESESRKQLPPAEDQSERTRTKQHPDRRAKKGSVETAPKETEPVAVEDRPRSRDQGVIKPGTTGSEVR